MKRLSITIGAVFLVACSLLFAFCSRPDGARVVAHEAGCCFHLAPISDEYANGVSAGMTMCGLFTKTTAENLGNGCWQFTGTYRK